MSKSEPLLICFLCTPPACRTQPLSRKTSPCNGGQSSFFETNLYPVQSIFKVKEVIKESLLGNAAEERLPHSAGMYIYIYIIRNQRLGKQKGATWECCFAAPHLKMQPQSRSGACWEVNQKKLLQLATRNRLAANHIPVKLRPHHGTKEAQRRCAGHPAFAKIQALYHRPDDTTNPQ